MWRTNETRHTEWHETCKCKGRLDGSVCNNKPCWNDDKCRRECKKLIDQGVCDKEFIWTPSNCESQCNKYCDVGEYLDYENCKCRNKLVDKLTEECIENVEEVKIAKTTLAEDENKHECSSCTLYIVLFSIIFAISVGIGSYFLYFHWYWKKDAIRVNNLMNLWMGKVKQIEIKNRTYHFYNDVINLENFESNLFKINKNHYKGIDIY